MSIKNKKFTYHHFVRSGIVLQSNCFYTNCHIVKHETKYSTTQILVAELLFNEVFPCETVALEHHKKERVTEQQQKQFFGAVFSSTTSTQGPSSRSKLLRISFESQKCFFSRDSETQCSERGVLE